MIDLGRGARRALAGACVLALSVGCGGSSAVSCEDGRVVIDGVCGCPAGTVDDGRTCSVPDGGAGDGGIVAPDGGADAGTDAGVDVVPLPASLFVSTSGGGTVSSPRYRARLSVGAPGPMGSSRSSGRVARFGPEVGR